MKSSIVLLLSLSLCCAAQAEDWKDSLKEVQPLLQESSPSTAAATLERAHRVHEQLSGFENKNSPFRPAGKQSGTKYSGHIHLSEGHPGPALCQTVRQRFTATAKNMKLLKEWVLYLDALLKMRQPCSGKVGHALSQIDQLIKLIATGYPDAYDQRDIEANYSWALALPKSLAADNALADPPMEWVIEDVEVETVSLQDLSWPIGESPVAIDTSFAQHAITFAMPLSLTQICMGRMSPVVSGSIRVRISASSVSAVATAEMHAFEFTIQLDP